MKCFKTLTGPAHCSQLANQTDPLKPNNCRENVPLLLTSLQAINTASPTKLSEKRSALYSTTRVSNWILGSLSKPLTDWIGTPHLVCSSAHTQIPSRPQGCMLTSTYSCSLPTTVIASILIKNKQSSNKAQTVKVCTCTILLITINHISMH